VPSPRQPHPAPGSQTRLRASDLTANVHVHSALETGRPAPDRYFHSPPAVTPSPMVLRTRTRMEPDSPEIGDIRGLVRRNGPLSRGFPLDVLLEPRDVRALTLAAPRRFDNNGDGRRTHHLREGSCANLTLAEVGVPIGPGVEGIAGIVGVD